MYTQLIMVETRVSVNYRIDHVCAYDNEYYFSRNRFIGIVQLNEYFESFSVQIQLN